MGLRRERATRRAALIGELRLDLAYAVRALVVAAVAVYLPARRASRVDPLEALRFE